MGLLQDIQSALVSIDKSLTDVLRMAKILAAKLDNALLREWVDQELNGYAKEASLPPYRAPRKVPVYGVASRIRWKSRTGVGSQQS
jgi:AbiTii-like protein